MIARVPAVPMNETRREQIVGEAKLLRALHYYFLAGLRARTVFGGNQYADVLARLPQDRVHEDRSALLYPDAPDAAQARR